MLQISPKQLDAFGGAAEERFAARLVEYLRENHAEAVEGLSDETLKQRALLGVCRGSRSQNRGLRQSRIPTPAEDANEP